MARVASIKTLRNSSHSDEGTASIIHFLHLFTATVLSSGECSVFQENPPLSRKIIALWTAMPYEAENASEVKCGRGKTEQEAIGGSGKDRRRGCGWRFSRETNGKRKEKEVRKKEKRIFKRRE